jgi:hypothetical protein
MVKNKLRAMGMKNPIVMTAGYEPEGEVTEGRRGPDNALGGADRDDSPRYRGLGSPTRRQQEEEDARANAAAERAKARLRRSLAREEERKRNHNS